MAVITVKKMILCKIFIYSFYQLSKVYGPSGHFEINF